MVSSFDIGHEFLDERDESLGDSTLDNYPFRGHANLSGIEQRARYDSACCVLDVGIVENL